MRTADFTILIPGISGMIGKILAHHWAAHGYQVIGLSRNPKQHETNLPHEAMIVGWDALTPEFFTIRRINAIVNLAGAPMMQKWDKRSKPEILMSRLTALESIYSTVRKLPPSRRPKIIINASSIAIYSNQNKTVDESCEPDLDINFFQSLIWLKLEKRMHELYIPDIRNVIARLGLLIGPHRMMQQMLNWSRLGAGAILGDGDQNICWISHHDLARAFDHFITNDNCRNVYNVVSPEPTTAKQLSESIASAANRTVKLRLPERFLHIVLGELANNFLVSAKVAPARLNNEGFTWNIPGIHAAIEHSRWALERTSLSTT